MKKILIDRTILKRLYVYKRYSQDDIGRKFNCSQWVISNRLRFFCIKTRPRTCKLSNRKYTYNKNFLEKISPDVAWFLGVLLSDGYVRRKDVSGYFGLKMKREDEDVILKVKKITGYNGPIYRVSTRLMYKGHFNIFYLSALQVSDIKAVGALERLGIKQNKTLNEKFLKCIKETKSEEIIRNFIRGIYDGDGSILWDGKMKSACFQIVGTYSLLRDIQRYLIRYCHLDRTKLTQNILNTNHFALRYRGNLQAIKILDWLYKYSIPSIRMDRKFNKFIEIRRLVTK